RFTRGAGRGGGLARAGHPARGARAAVQHLRRGGALLRTAGGRGGAAGVIAIVGGGPAGCLLALLLARRGEQVQVYERRADPRVVPPEAGRSINLALAARGKRALAAAGALDGLVPHMVPMPGRLLHPAAGTP